MNNRWEWQQWKKTSILLSWRPLKKWRKRYLELGWELQSTEGLIFILILLGKGNRGSRTWPNESVIQPKQMCWHDSGIFQKYQDSFWLWNTCCSALSESLKGLHFRASGLKLLWGEGKIGNASYFNQTVSKDPEQPNSAPLPFMPFFTSYSTRRKFGPVEAGANLKSCSNEWDREKLSLDSWGHFDSSFWSTGGRAAG